MFEYVSENLYVNVSVSEYEWECVWECEWEYVTMCVWIKDCDYGMRMWVWVRMYLWVWEWKCKCEYERQAKSVELRVWNPLFALLGFTMNVWENKVRICIWVWEF